MPANHMIFETRSGNRYLYDAFTSSVHPWNPPLSDAFAKQLYSATDQDAETAALTEYDIPDEYRFYIQLWRRVTGAFRDTPAPERHVFKTLEEIPPHRAGKLRYADLILIASEACNLRCAYCVYSSLYDGYRTHGGKLLSWEVAKKAIDLFYAYNNGPTFRGYSDRALNIVFYGGEPLLNFDVVRRAILYAEQAKQLFHRVLISISTNLTLLSMEQLSFCREHDVFLNVSLDGPPEEHNRYRVFRDGRPTAEVVLDRLKQIRELDQVYYQTRVSLLPTVNGQTDLTALLEFFESHQAELPPIKLVSLLKDLEFCAFHQAHPYDKALFRSRADQVVDTYYQSKLAGAQYERGQFLYHFVEESLLEVYQRLHAFGKSNPNWYTGTCAPGRKLAVYPDGTIHLCERINEYHPIGHVDYGIQEEKWILGSKRNRHCRCSTNTGRVDRTARPAGCATFVSYVWRPPVRLMHSILIDAANLSGPPQREI
jgi:uncharacterized protein